MNVTQAYAITNDIFGEVTGRSVVLAEDLSNIVDAGKEYAQLSGNNWLDNYAKGALNRIGKDVFVNRKYRGRVPSIKRDAWEYGSAMCKTDAEVGDFEENETWSLVDGQTYNQDVFKAPVLHQKFWNQRSTFELDLSRAERQIQESLTSAEALVAFYSMIETKIENKLTKAIQAYSMRALNNAIGVTLHDNNANRAVNLLSLYNAGPNSGGTPLTFPGCLTDAAFLRYAAFIIKQYPSRMQDLSVLFNVGGKERFTPDDKLHTIIWDRFRAAAGTYLIDANGQFLTDDIKLPLAEEVSYWQAPGLTYSDADCSSIDITTSEGDVVQASGILAVMFDHDTVGVSNFDRRVRTHVNDKAEFINMFFKVDMGLWNDFDENFVVFYAA